MLRNQFFVATETIIEQQDEMLIYAGEKESFFYFLLSFRVSLSRVRPRHVILYNRKFVLEEMGEKYVMRVR